MGTTSEHRRKWLHNRAFLGRIEDEFPDWMVTTMFYAALHAVEVVFAFDRVAVHGSHRNRNQTLKRHNRYKALWRNYRPLHDAARTSRYEVSAEDWIPAEDVKGQLVTYLYRLEQSVQRLTGEDQQLPPVW